MSNQKYSLDNIVSAGDECMTLNAQTLCLPQLIQELLSSNSLALHTHQMNGILNKSINDLKDKMNFIGGRLFLTQELFGDYTFIWEDKSYINILYSSDTKGIHLNCNSLSQDRINQFKEIGEEFISKQTKGLVYAIIKDGQYLETKYIGNGSSQLIESNYNPKVIQDLKYCVESFANNPDSSKLVIIHGEPGTGKSYLLRNIIGSLDKVFLIIPSNMVSSLDGPELLPILFNLKESSKKSIILLIEDGDMNLVPRESDNMSAIAALLNLSDGILGSLLDIKIITTTNAKINEMDKAILRPGRLLKQIDINALSYPEANVVYQRLMKNDQE